MIVRYTRSGDGKERAKMPTNAITDSLKSALAKDLASLPQVHHIETECSDGALFVWIFLEDASPTARRQI